jgi:hypothetical protein
VKVSQGVLAELYKYTNRKTVSSTGNLRASHLQHLRRVLSRISGFPPPASAQQNLISTGFGFAEKMLSLYTESFPEQRALFFRGRVHG